MTQKCSDLLEITAKPFTVWSLSLKVGYGKHTRELFCHLVVFHNRSNADVLNIVIILIYQFYFVLFLLLRIDCDERILILFSPKKNALRHKLNDQNPFSCSSSCLSYINVFTSQIFLNRIESSALMITS